MNKLEILIKARVEELELATQCQEWKSLAYIDTSGGQDSKCWSIAMDYSNKGLVILDFSHRLVGEAFVKRTRDKVLFDPRVSAALEVWHLAYVKAKETYAEWLIDTGSRAKEQAA